MESGLWQTLFELKFTRVDRTNSYASRKKLEHAALVHAADTAKHALRIVALPLPPLSEFLNLIG